MASVTLTDLWLHDAVDPSDSVQLGQNAQMVDASQPVEVRRYAGGRLRSVSRPGQARQVQITCPAVSRANYLDLKARVGVTQMLRDQRGLKLWGMISSVSASEFLASDLLEQVSFTFAEVTYSEVV